MRHYNALHAKYQRKYWCPAATCKRSAENGTMPFDRRDRRDDHVSKVHMKKG